MIIACTLDYDWWPRYVVAALVSLFGGVVILLPFKLAWHVLERRRRRRRPTTATRLQSTLCQLQSSAERITAGNSPINKTIMTVFWLADVIAVGTYLVHASMMDVKIRDNCGPATEDELYYVWVVAICIGCVRFIIKFVASTDHLMTWIDLYALVDHLTIVPTFMGIYYNTNWIGLRFLRFICLLNTPELLQRLHIIKRNSHIRVVKVLTIMLIVWMLGTSMYFLLENNGDPFYDYENNENLTFWNGFYYVLISMTTIGYGDISPKTVLGKAFTVVFVVAALGTFCTLIPEIGKAMGSRTRYRTTYKSTSGRRHIIICGGITFETLTTVVKNFIHEDAAMKNTDIVIIDINKPSGELQAFFRRHFSNVTFIQGTVLDIPTLKLAKAETADAVLILANRQAENEDEEDAGNIMRVTALKNLSSDIRIILQLLQHHNKERLLHIPGWSWHQVSADDVDASDEAAGPVGWDEVICLSELKLGFMAQNCLAPGIVTMLSNLICMRSYKPGNKKKWLDEYCYGAAHEIYAGSFARDFIGLTFTDAADLCLKEFGILLVAVSCPQAHGGKFRVNPGNSLVIRQGHVGFFIAQGPNEVRSVASYRGGYRPDEQQPLVKVNSKARQSVSESGDDDSMYYVSLASEPIQNKVADGTLQSQPPDVNLNEDSNNNDADVFDCTNMFHWRPDPSFDSVVLDSQSVRDYSFSDHVIFVLCAGSYSQDIGLVNFVRPLRTSSLLTHRLHDIIFYTDPSIIEAEWQTIANFPKLYVYPRSRSINIDLRHLGVQKCSMCLVLGANDAALIDNALVDTSSILTTKNILSLREIEDKMAKIGVLVNSAKFRRRMPISREIPMLIELEHDASVTYIDDDDEDDPSLPLYHTMPYVCGKVLLASVLDSLVAATYLNSDMPTLIRALLTGGEATELESLLTERVGLVRRQTIARREAARRRCSLTLLNLNDPLLANIDHEMKYLRLVRNCLRTYGLLCLGVYRQLDEVVDENEAKGQRTLTQKRYVITHPPTDFRLIDTDKIYALKPFEADIGSVSPAVESSTVLADGRSTSGDVTLSPTGDVIIAPGASSSSFDTQL